jgi:hypothetical protein
VREGGAEGAPVGEAPARIDGELLAVGVLERDKEGVREGAAGVALPSAVGATVQVGVLEAASVLEGGPLAERAAVVVPCGSLAVAVGAPPEAVGEDGGVPLPRVEAVRAALVVGAPPVALGVGRGVFEGAGEKDSEGEPLPERVTAGDAEVPPEGVRAAPDGEALPEGEPPRSSDARGRFAVTETGAVGAPVARAEALPPPNQRASGGGAREGRRMVTVG